MIHPSTPSAESDPDRPLREDAISSYVPVDWTLTEIARALDAELLLHPDSPEGEVGSAGISTDRIQPGQIFVALRGTRTHGVQHAHAAAEAGASAILVGSDADPESVAEAAQLLSVLRVETDALVGLGRLARAWRRLRIPVVIGITGSSGKTSTKDLLSGILRTSASCHASLENNNNEIGVPLTLLAAPPETQVVICEMGMRGPGQIDYLCSIAEPNIGIITNTGLAHVELLGSRDQIAQAKAELFATLPTDGLAVYPAAQPELLQLGGSPQRSQSFSSQDPQLGAWPLAVAGEHQRSNLAAALCAAQEACLRLGLPQPEPSDVPLTVSKGRGERIDHPSGLTILDDSYNANPDSMRAALTELARTPGKQHIAVLGLMAELGDHGAREHRDLGRFIAEEVKPDLVVLVGDNPLMDALAQSLGSVPVRRVLIADSALRIIESVAGSGDVVLVKASRSVRLEGVVQGLIESTLAVEGPPT